MLWNNWTTTSAVFITRIGKAKQISAWALSLCGDKTGIFKYGRAFSFWIDFCSDPHLRSWILGYDWKNISNTSGREGIFAKCSQCDTAVKFVKPCEQSSQLWNAWSPECGATYHPNRDPSYVVSAICPEYPKGDWRDKFCWLHPRQRSPGEFAQGAVEVTTSLPCLASPWCGASRTIWYCWWRWGISSPTRDTAPATHPQTKKRPENYLSCMQGRIYL